MSEEPKYFIKGVAVKALRAFAVEKLGEDGFLNTLEGLPEETKELFGRSYFVMSDWYDVEHGYLPLLEAVCEKVYGGNISKGAWDYGRYSASKGLTRVYKIFLKLGSPEFIIPRAGNLMAAYHKPSRIQIMDETKDYCLVRIFETVPRETLYWEIAGYIDMLLELIGMKKHGVKINTFISDKCPYTEMLVEWA